MGQVKMNLLTASREVSRGGFRLSIPPQAAEYSLLFASFGSNGSQLPFDLRLQK